MAFLTALARRGSFLRPATVMPFWPRALRRAGVAWGIGWDSGVVVVSTFLARARRAAAPPPGGRSGSDSDSVGSLSLSEIGGVKVTVAIGSLRAFLGAGAGGDWACCLARLALRAATIEPGPRSVARDGGMNGGGIPGAGFQDASRGTAGGIGGGLDGPAC